MRIRDVIGLHQIDIFRIRDCNEHVLPSDTKRLRQYIFDISNVFEYFENQNRIKRSLAKRQRRIDVNDRQTTIYRTQIREIHVTSYALSSFLDQRQAVGAETTPQIQNRSTRILAGKTYECAIVLPWQGRNTRFVKIISSQHVNSRRVYYHTMKRAPHIVVVLPAYNAAKTLERTYADIPKDFVSNIILVDDVSQDQTVDVARSLGLSVVIHIQNRGYGGNQKTCYLEALKLGADIVVMLHPDHQYDSRLIPQLVQPIIDQRADMVMGSRILNGMALQGGMPIWKFISNRALTIAENLVYRSQLTDCHTGFRAFSRNFLTTVPFLLNSDDFVFDSQMIAQAVRFGFRIIEIPVQARYFPEASSVNFRVSTIYGVKTVGVMSSFLLNKLKLSHTGYLEKNLADVVSRHHHNEIFR